MTQCIKSQCSKSCSDDSKKYTPDITYFTELHCENSSKYTTCAVFPRTTLINCNYIATVKHFLEQHCVNSNSSHTVKNSKCIPTVKYLLELYCDNINPKYTTHKVLPRVTVLITSTVSSLLLFPEDAASHLLLSFMHKGQFFWHLV